jgi:replicative DNA helicase
MAVERSTTERVPPQALEAEMAVLGAALLDREAISRALELLDQSAFYKQAHREIFRAVVDLYLRNEAVDLVTLSDALRRNGQLENIGGAEYLESLVESVPTSGNVEYHARIVLEKSTLRKLIESATEIVGRSFEETERADEVLDKAEQLIFKISEERLKQTFIPIRSILKHSFEMIEDLYASKRHVTGVPSGFPDLDSKTSGFQTSDLVIVAGRPSMGKTAFSLNVAQHVAIEEKMPVGIFSLEMSKEQLVQRMLCSEARVDSHRLRTGYLSDAEWPKLTTAAGLLSEAQIYIDDSPAISVLEMRAKARRLKADVDVGIIIVDYLQLISGPPGIESRQQEISSISRSLKALAKEINVPVVALSQLSRAVEARGGRLQHRPVLSDLRESGAIEQDADVVLFVYRPEIYDDSPENMGIAEVIIGKQRNGPTGTVKMAFISEYTRFQPLATREFTE